MLHKMADIYWELAACAERDGRFNDAYKYSKKATECEYGPDEDDMEYCQDRWPRS